MTRAMRAGILVKREIRVRLSEEVKSHLSEVRKKWLKDNPERHPWRSKEKFKSVPCNVLKDILIKEGLSFVSEYIPLQERSFSLDIAFPDKKIAIEVNGNQHYEADGRLKPYYQERHNLIESSGWKLIELHYSTVYNNDLIQKLIFDLKQSYSLGLVDYSFYQTEQEKIREERQRKVKEPKWFCKKCAVPLVANAKSGLCVNCLSVQQRRVARPSKDQLLADVASTPMVSIGKKYGVSDNAVKKWCKSYGIVLGSRRGYWQKHRSNNPEPAIVHPSSIQAPV